MHVRNKVPGRCIKNATDAKGPLPGNPAKYIISKNILLVGALDGEVPPPRHICNVPEKVCCRNFGNPRRR